MNPYSRFRFISNMAAAALMAGSLCAVWPVASALLVTETGGAALAYKVSVAGIAAALVLASLVITEWVFPALFQVAFLRKLVLGKHYIEGTWLQAERGPAGSERLTVLIIRPRRYGFGLSGYCLNQESEIESNRMVEYSKLDGPVLAYAYRSLMPDGAGNQARGMGELMFEQRRGAPKAFSGHGEPVGARRFQVEGVKLTKWSERRRLRKLEQRAEVVEKYWDLFFGTAHEAAGEAAPALRRPVIITAAKPGASVFVDRRNPEKAAADDGPVITRRRASDWRSEDTTPTADRIRSRMMANAGEVEEEEDELLLEEEIEAELDETVEFEVEVEVEAEDEVMLEEEDEDLEAEEEYQAGAGDDEEVLDEVEDIEDEAEFEDAADGEDAEETDAAVTEEEPVRIRQRYARR